MKKLWGKATALILALVLVLSTASFTALAAEDTVEIVIMRKGITEGEQEQTVRDAVSAKIEQDLGVKVKFTVIAASEIDELNQKVFLRASSGDSMDIIVNSNVQLSNLLSKPGLIAPLDELLEKYGANITASIPEDTLNRFRVDGKLMAIPDNDGNAIQEGIIVRKDWLDKLGLEVPRTLEEFENMLEAFKTQDPDGNGVNDTIPLLAQENRMNLCFAPCVTGVAPSTFTFPGIWNYYDEEKDEVRPTFIHPNYKAELYLIKKWYENSWLNADFLISTDDQNREMFRQGKAGAYANSWFLVEMESDMKKALGDQVQLTAVVSLEGPADDLWLGRPKTDGIFCIPECSKNKELAVQILNWMLENKENYQLCKYGIEGETYKKVGDNQWTEPTENANPNLYSGALAGVVVPDFELYSASLPSNYTELKTYANAPDCELVYGTLAGVAVVFDKYKNVQAQCDTARKEWLTKMATGALDIEENFDKFVEEWINQGGNIYIKEMTAAYHEYQKNIGK